MENQENEKSPLKNSDNIVIRNEKGQLLPGVVLNPKGKPKGIRHMTTLLEEAIKKVAGDTGTSEDVAIVKKVIELARKGDMKAIEHIWDRMEGKAPQTIQTNQTNIQINLHDPNALATLDEQLAIIRTEIERIGAGKIEVEGD